VTKKEELIERGSLVVHLKLHHNPGEQSRALLI